MKICESSLLQCAQHSETSLNLSYFASSGGGMSFGDVLAQKSAEPRAASGKDEKIAGNRQSKLVAANSAAATTGTVDDEEHLRLLNLLHQLFADMLASLDGKKCTSTDLKDTLAKLKAGKSQGAEPVTLPVDAADWTIQRTDVRVEHEATSYCASGTVRTADGRCIDLQVDYSLSRDSATVTSISSSVMDGVLKDPLVLRLGGGSMLSGETRRFDLDGDGKSEQVASFGAGYGLLALDQNGNGKVDDGRELFGTQSGDGFADLMQYDQDHNGWIDENDPVFGRLSLWTQGGEGDKSGDRLTSLKQAGIGALSLTSTATPFALKQDGKTEGQLRASGVYLHEDGRADVMQQVDLNVGP
jgi:hypothetical protein